MSEEQNPLRVFKLYTCALGEGCERVGDDLVPYTDKHPGCEGCRRLVEPREK